MPGAGWAPVVGQGDVDGFLGEDAGLLVAPIPIEAPGRLVVGERRGLDQEEPAIATTDVRLAWPVMPSLAQQGVDRGGDEEQREVGVRPVEKPHRLDDR